MRAIAAVAFAAALWPAPASAAERSVASGPLRATVATAPWHLRFADGRGPLLDELGGSGTALPGTLAYAAGGTWFHATHVVSERRTGGGRVFKVATTNPLGP